jgi:hypothetical protein
MLSVKAFFTSFDQQLGQPKEVSNHGQVLAYATSVLASLCLLLVSHFDIRDIGGKEAPLINSLPVEPSWRN